MEQVERLVFELVDLLNYALLFLHVPNEQFYGRHLRDGVLTASPSPEPLPLFLFSTIVLVELRSPEEPLHWNGRGPGDC